MKGILIAGVFAAFAITVIDSLSCMQCPPSTENCPTNKIDCGDEKYKSCVESSVSSTLGGSKNSYENKFCSEINCINNSNSVVVSFTVHVSDDQQFNFASQCCEVEECPGNNKEDSGPRNLTNTQCPSCYGNNTESCNETTQQCSEGEQCVHIVIQYGNEGATKEVELKGCSDISDTTCKTLDSEGIKVGEFTFKKVNCTSATTIPVTTTTTPTTVTTTPSTSTSLKASFISSVFGSLLLLKLLF